jgi:hypothetical protein
MKSGLLLPSSSHRRKLVSMAGIDPSPRGCNPITKSGALILISVVSAKAGTQGFESLVPGSPLSRRAVRGKSCGDHRSEIAFPISSWPGSTRPSTPWGRNKDVDTRIKSSQDKLKLLLAHPPQVILARKFSPDSPALSRGQRIGRSTAFPDSLLRRDDDRRGPILFMAIFPMAPSYFVMNCVFGD